MCVCMCFYLCKCRSFMSMSPTLFHNFPNHCSSKYLGQLLPDIFRGSHAQILHVSAGCASCMSLPGMHLACLCGVCILHVSAGCSYCMSLPGVHIACLCRVCILHVSAGCASCMSLPGAHIACLCRVCILHVSARCLISVQVAKCCPRYCIKLTNVNYSRDMFSRPHVSCCPTLCGLKHANVGAVPSSVGKL